MIQDCGQPGADDCGLRTNLQKHQGQLHDKPLNSLITNIKLSPQKHQTQQTKTSNS